MSDVTLPEPQSSVPDKHQGTNQSVVEKSRGCFRLNQDWLAVTFLILAPMCTLITIFSVIGADLSGRGFWSADIYNIFQSRVVDGSGVVPVFLFLILLVLAPVIAIVTFSRQNIDTMTNQIRTELILCGLGKNSRAKTVTIEERVKSFQDKNRPAAFFPPILVMTSILFLLWIVVLFPRGYWGLYNTLYQGGVVFDVFTSVDETIPVEDISDDDYFDQVIIAPIISIDAFFDNLILYSSPITWVFLGAYIYILGSIIRRWMLSDITVGFTWRLTTRLFVAVAFGLLLTLVFSTVNSDFLNISGATDSDEGSSAVFNIQDYPISDRVAQVSGLESGAGKTVSDIISVSYYVPPRPLPIQTRWLFMVAFFAGIVPDIALKWISQRVQRVLNMNGSESAGDWASNIFKPSELQVKISGLNFWQADRLFDEGIEDIQNLATKDLPDLLVKTRFDSQRLVDWVDQAILHSQLSPIVTIDHFKAAGIWKATDLMDIWSWPDVSFDATLQAERTERRKRLIKSLFYAYRLDRRDNPENPLSDDELLEYLTNLVENIVEGIQLGPNLHFIREYWRNATPEERARTLESYNQKADIVITPNPAYSG